MIDQALALLTKKDTYAAIEYLSQQADPLAVANAYTTLVTQLYWDEKNLPAVIAMGRAGAQYALAAALNTDDETAAQLRGIAKGICYNLASFTWPGWDEPGFEITASDIAVGLDAAKANLRYAQELDKGDLPLSRAYWMIGVHYLATRNPQQATPCFSQAEAYAATAQSTAETLLAQGFGQMAALLANPADEAAQQQLTRIKQDLNQLEHGADFVAQIETAMRVFGT